MTISSRSSSGVLILEPGGRLTLGAGDVELGRAVETILATEAPQVLVSLREVEVIDSSGIGSLVAACNRVRASGGAFKLVHLPARVQNVLHIAHLQSVFEIFDDEHSAIESFGTAGAPGPDSRSVPTPRRRH